jgi:hypothetical protein
MSNKPSHMQPWPFRPDRSLITSRDKGRSEAELRAILGEQDEGAEEEDEHEAAPPDPT